MIAKFGGWLMPHPGPFTLRKETRYPLQGGGWVQNRSGWQWTSSVSTRTI